MKIELITEELLGQIVEAKGALVRKFALELTEKDQVIVIAARQLSRDRYKRDVHHLAACGWGFKQAEHYSALQLNCKRARESSVCAEAGILTAAAIKDDEISTIVTFHGNHNGGGPYVVPPCALCVTRFQRFAPNCWVVVEDAGKLIKVPQLLLMNLVYPKADHLD